MANDVFNIATDLSIKYFNSTIGAYVDIVADSFEVDIDRGIEIENGVFTRGSIGTATIKLVKKNLADFLGTPGYKANDRIFIEYKPLPDSSPGTVNVLFGGYIQNVSMGYINESGNLEITIVANDIMRWAMNVIIPSFAISGTVTQRSYRNCMINLFAAISTQASAIGGVTLQAIGAGASGTTQRVSPTYLNLPAGEIVTKYIDAELGWMFANKNLTNTVKYAARADINTLQAVAWNPASPTVSNVHYSDLMTNGTFEVNTTGWTAGSGTTLTRVTTTYFAGVASARLHAGSMGTTPYFTFTNTTMAFTAGDKVQASYWVKNDINTDTSRATISFINSGGTTIGQAIGVYSAINGTDWTQLSVTGVAPAGTVRASMTISGTRTASGASAMFIDNVKLQNLTTISNNHYCLDNIDLVYDSDSLVNKAIVTDTVTGTKYVATNAASIAANGEQSLELDADLDPAGASTFAALATEVANAATIKQVAGVTVPVIRDDGKVGTIANFEIAETLQVEFAQEPLPALQVVSLIRRINHVITPQHWEMNIGLWRAI